MTELQRPVAYLEDHDFDPSGRLITPDIPHDMLVVIMIQASWCGHCEKAKSAFQTFAENHQGVVFCATVQTDGERSSEKKLGERIPSISPDFRGYPDYLLYKNGDRIQRNITGRTIKDLKYFTRTYL